MYMYIHFLRPSKQGDSTAEDERKIEHISAMYAEAYLPRKAKTWYRKKKYICFLDTISFILEFHQIKYFRLKWKDFWNFQRKKRKQKKNERKQRRGHNVVSP